MYSSTTHNITVTVEPSYLGTESRPDDTVFVWSYKIRIENGGTQAVQLKTRHWKITDSYGRVQEVHGPGVVGKQPTLGPGEFFEYTSGTPLSTPCGFMTGSYSMIDVQGEMFDVSIPLFSLDMPDAPRICH